MTHPVTSLDVTSDFDEVLLSQFRDAENINKLKDIILRPLQDTADLCAYILGHTSIWDEDRLAEGPMLDFCGSVVGYARPDAQEDSANILTLANDSTEEDLSFGSQCMADDITGELGGYFTTTTGQVSVTNPGAKETDSRYIRFVRAKAAAFGKKPTHINMWSFMNSMNVRSKITNPETKVVLFEPLNFRDTDYYTISYILENGLNPTACHMKWCEDCDIYNMVFFDSQL